MVNDSVDLIYYSHRERRVTSPICATAARRGPGPWDGCAEVAEGVAAVAIVIEL
jgi:hypothetical protein